MFDKSVRNSQELNSNHAKFLPTESPQKQIDDARAQRSLKLKGYVGFDKLASQYVQKCAREGFAFNILCIGETGIGKSTLMDTLFNTSFNLEPSSHNQEKVGLNSSQYELHENGIRLKLTLIETSGYGDQINKENSHVEILKYIDEQYESFVQAELGLRRKFRQSDDTRVHLCLYFICPTGHSLKALDLNTMKALHKTVNIVPIVSRSDLISKSELSTFKKRIMNELSANHVNIYRFPTNDYDSNVNNLNATANSLYPLAVIGSIDLVKIGNKLTRGRMYEWGTVSVENESHCDFLKFREMLLSTNMLDLIEQTHAKHYQLYRAQRLREIYGLGGDQDETCESIQEVYNAKREQFNSEIERKESEIKEAFIRRVKEKEMDIRQIENDLNERYNLWKNEQVNWSDEIEQKRRQLDEEMREFQERKHAFERAKFSTLNSNGKSSKKK